MSGDPRARTPNAAPRPRAPRPRAAAHARALRPARSRPPVAPSRRLAHPRASSLCALPPLIPSLPGIARAFTAYAPAARHRACPHLSLTHSHPPHPPTGNAPQSARHCALTALTAHRPLPPSLPDIARVFTAYAKFGHDRADLFIPLARCARAAFTPDAAEHTAHAVAVRPRTRPHARAAACLAFPASAAHGLHPTPLPPPRIARPGPSTRTACAR